MANFIYKARDATGKLIRGTMEAAGKEELVDKLRKMGYMATHVAEAGPGVRIESFFGKLMPVVSVEDKIMFYVQFSNMINAGIPILTILQTLNKQIENKTLKEAVGGISRSVEAGDSLSAALSKYPRIFPRLFASMVKAGEASGKLDTVLLRYAEFSEREADLRQKIKEALFYPTILLFAGLAVTLFIVTFIVPQFAEIFIKTGIKLPVPTQILYNVGTAIKRYWYLFIIFAIAIWAAVKYYINTKRGKLGFDRFRLKLPVIGPLYRKSEISRFARTLATLVASGVPILQSLDIVRDVVRNEVLARAVGNVRSAVERGQKIGETLKIGAEFPPDTVQMISVGEESGKLDEMLSKVSDFYDMSLGYTIKKLTAVIEPLFLLIMGGLVGFIMASMLLPIFDMIKILRH